MDFIYDTETFPNCFLICIKEAGGDNRWQFEISDRCNHSEQIVGFCEWLQWNGHRMVGFNNLGFDYPILHMLLQMRYATADVIYEKAMAIIHGGDKFTHMVWPSDRRVPQIDLYKIHHFDNRARTTSLKTLEFNMQLDFIEDLPFEVGTPLVPKQMDDLAEYCWNDITATEAFWEKTKPMIEFREEISKKYGRDFLNHNDTKIGKDFLIMQLESAGVQCFERGSDGRRTPKQTPRSSIRLGDVIFDDIEFTFPEFQAVLDQLRNTVITETKDAFKAKPVAEIDGFKFIFGTGGIHGSVSNAAYESDDDVVILDLDVTSFYPSLAITRGLYPEHLGPEFVEIYRDLREQRVHHAKGTPQNAMLKLALNGVYGDSNNPYSPFFDPHFTMAITLNGQLLLCLLAEYLWEDIKMIQANTDGITVLAPRNKLPLISMFCAMWEQKTGLQLEWQEYTRMWIRDVNNYIAEYDA